jgi:hypothetical protein
VPAGRIWRRHIRPPPAGGHYEPRIPRRGAACAEEKLAVETAVARPLKHDEVLVRIKAAGLCHTDLEVIEGQLRYPMLIVLKAGTVIRSVIVF